MCVDELSCISGFKRSERITSPQLMAIIPLNNWKTLEPQSESQIHDSSCFVSKKTIGEFDP